MSRARRVPSRPRVAAVLLCCTATFLCCFALPAYADEYHVHTSEQLRAALLQAGRNGEDDTVYLAGGTYEGGFNCDELDGYSLVIRGEPGTTARDVILHGGDRTSVLRLAGPLEGEMRMEGVTLQHGSSGIHGGGLYIEVWGDADLKVEVRNSVLRFNQAGKRGGGLAAKTQGGNSSIDLLLVNTVIYGNQARWSGGGVEVTSSEAGENNFTRATMVNCTVTDNLADAESAGFEQGGGIRVKAYQGTGGSSSLIMYNSIVYGNHLGNGTAQDLHVDQNGHGVTQVTAYHSDIGDVTGIPTLYTPVDVIDASPSFYAPLSHDYHLRAGSPCIDAGTASVPTPPGLPVSDFDGDARVIGVAPDIGADEARPPVFLFLPLCWRNQS